MENACRFVQRRVQVAPWRGGPARGRADDDSGSLADATRRAGVGAIRRGGGDAIRRAGVDAARRGGGDAIADLLAGLRGREVTLQVGERLLTGKLLLADPVVLVDGAGRATFVRPGAVLAVTF